MSDQERPDIELRPWSEGDLPLLERLLGDPAMMTHLGGPETPEQIRKRNERYCLLDEAGTGQMFVIMEGVDRHAVGSIGYWEKEWHGDTVWETGWFVLPEYQGRGFASGAIAALVEEVRAVGKHRFLHAYPSGDNAASNAVCRKAGFVLGEAEEFEYPKGHFMHCNDWYLDLTG